MFEELYWGLPVIGYLFLAGVGAGAVVVSAFVALGAGNIGSQRFAVARYGALIAPVPVIVGTLLLIVELGQPFRALNLFKLINLSPMSIGSWVVGLFIVVSMLYAATYLLPSAHFGDRFEGLRRALAWLCLPLGFGLAVYTAVLLGAMPARPFWNSPAIALLFVLSAMSGGIASIVLAMTLFGRSRDGETATDHNRATHLLGGTDAVLLLGELLVILLFLLFAQLSIGSVRESAAVILPGGELALPFWGVVVLTGILLPTGMELGLIAPGHAGHLAFTVKRTLAFLVPIMILVGGFALRYVVVVAGQVTGPVGI